MVMMPIVPTPETNPQPRLTKINNIPDQRQYSLIKQGAQGSITPHKKLTTHNIGFTNVI